MADGTADAQAVLFATVDNRGRFRDQSAALYLACAAVFHRKGPRIATSRLGIYGTLADGGGTPDKDPDTKQPLWWGIVQMNVSVQAIPA